VSVNGDNDDDDDDDWIQLILTAVERPIIKQWKIKDEQKMGTDVRENTQRT
jgi:hypothetical protein